MSNSDSKQSLCIPQIGIFYKLLKRTPVAKVRIYWPGIEMIQQLYARQQIFQFNFYYFYIKDVNHYLKIFFMNVRNKPLDECNQLFCKKAQ